MKLLNELQIKQIFKGDQNLFWDSFIADSAIAYYLKKEKSPIQFIPFVHDEKFGAPDQNLIHCLEKSKDSFFISEDYADSAGDATYLNLDVSYGIFYLPVVEETRLKEYSISLKSLSRAFVKNVKDLDNKFIIKCSKFGLFLDFDLIFDQENPIIPNKEELNCFFDIHPEQRIYYLFTRALGRFGVAPVKDNNVLLSSVYLKDANMIETLHNLLGQYLLEGAFFQTNPEEHQIIKSRYDKIISILDQTFHENGSIADLEENVTKSILDNMEQDYFFKLNRSSTILSFPEKYDIKHFYLKSFIENNKILSEIYNHTLNQTKMSIQRIRIGENLTNLPFYVNWKNETAKYTRSELILNNLTGQLVYKKQNDYEIFENNDDSFISGKAIPFLNEFRLETNLIALPEQGSKYTPACDAFVINSRLNKILIPDASILRISIHFLDNLKFLEDKELFPPRILFPFLGRSLSCFEFSQKWRNIVKEIERILMIMKNEVSDGRETVIARKLYFDYQKNKNKKITFAKFMDEDMFDLLIELTENYINILKLRHKKEKDLKLTRDYKLLTFKIKLIIRYYMQQLIQVKDGLNYLNDRPYSLSIYLMFGEYFMQELIKNVTFRIETV